MSFFHFIFLFGKGVVYLPSKTKHMQTQTLPETKFIQLCVWPGTLLDEEQIPDFEKFFLDEMGTRVKYHTQIKTNPDLDSSGNPVPETGGRSDVFFYVHSEDVSRFAVPRLQMGIRWWEDVIKYNDNAHLYPQSFIDGHPPLW
jgi:hypothetical protein